jgi:hypothetical protein
MGAYDRVCHVGRQFLLLVREIGAARDLIVFLVFHALPSRILKNATASLDRFFEMCGQCLIGPDRVCKLRVAQCRAVRIGFGNLNRKQRRGPARTQLKTQIRMPINAGIGAADGFAVFLNIRHEIDGGISRHAEILGPNVHIGFAEAGGQINLGIRRQILVMKNNDVILVKGIFDFGKHLVIEILKIDAFDHRAERGPTASILYYFKRHDMYLPLKEGNQIIICNIYNMQIRSVMKIVSAVLFGLCIVAAGPVAADSNENGILSIQIENDLFGSGDDRHYTNGIRLAWLSAENDVPNWVRKAAGFIPVFAVNGKLRTSYEIGHNLYTPDDISKTGLIQNERPYAGYLYAGVGLVSDTGQRLDNLQFSIGVVGPSALGEEIQRNYHDLINTTDPRGWDNQLKDELTFLLTYERKWRRFHEFKAAGLGVDLTPHIGAALGNVFTHGAAGVTVRIGDDLPNDY